MSSGSTASVERKSKHKSYGYRADLVWAGDRAGTSYADGLPPIRIASPPEFRGEAGVWTPEHLLVSAVNACTMTTFIALAQRIGLRVFSYESTAEGILEFAEGTYRFTRILVRPRVVVVSAEAVEVARKVMEDAHRSCLIANSLSAAVAVEPEIHQEAQPLAQARPVAQLSAPPSP